ncbi:putative phospholipid ABC transporter permease protein MlaE [Thalassovita gelatinovora]|uniref:Putative phospholipid ABC transporter permease protein MlaE n=1 Tax=Thalassovita gelatinovora TaxID=53501 RepID=A0A0P1FBN5_THAGE|nr:MlaE family lipid ABC transporter permease subunit [Thalassovita gelatinovora]QIZ80062.1 MlaE family lipid ABC transporter permease subunit [Thalassovita gelatinovora]CUH65471.1 putative phospholipid ABC transporter permease protein MlaE [Thalassovita gelatinovora]SER09135.1 phospholipid/cholesterol/gamma-HCH transport system permease protein [Thalassovita gelatinovora]
MTVTLPDRIVVARVDEIRAQLATVVASDDVTFDLSSVQVMDTAGAWLIIDLQSKILDRGGRCDIIGASPVHMDLVDVVRNSIPAKDAAKKPRHDFFDWLETVGKATWQAGLSLVEILSFFGTVIARFGGLMIHPRRLRFTSLVHHMQEIGLNAVPIVALMAFLIGVVMAFQGAVQLRQFGAEVFVVDLIAISVLRELGILLTAIIVAGRSGAAFTAAIGSMKMREEIDAMQTLGLDPIEVLVLPRVLGLVIMLPLLGFVADVMGLFGGAVMSWIELGVSPGMFQTRLYDSVDVWHYAVGMIKAPFFAIIIGIIGSYEGMKVGGDAESLGRLTSTSVVLSIFLVIVADAMFSIFFAIVGV